MSSSPPPVAHSTRKLSDTVSTDAEAEQILSRATLNNDTAASSSKTQSHPRPNDDNLSGAALFRVPDLKDVPSTPARNASTSQHTITSSTPLQAKLAGMVSLSHTIAHVYPLLRYDLDHHTERAPVDSWISGVIGDLANRIPEWTKFFAAKGFARTSTIDLSVQQYCNAPKEVDRYEPLCNILNSIIDFANSNNSFPNLPTQPLGKIRFCRNDPNFIRRANTQEAHRKPDILALSDEIYQKYQQIHHDERTIMRERDILEKNIKNSAASIEVLKSSRSGKSRSEVRGIENSIKGARQKVEDMEKRRMALVNSLQVFRERHGIPTNDNRTHQTAGPITYGISWNELLSTLEVKNKPLLERVAALQKWTLFQRARRLPSTSSDATNNANFADVAIEQPIRQPLSLQDHRQAHSSDRAKVGHLHLKRAFEAPGVVQSDIPQHDGAGRTKRLRGAQPDNGGIPIKDDEKASLKEQAASYAVELLASTNGTRSHCICITFNGQDVQFWYYDASGMIRSEILDWFEEFDKFAAIIVALGCLDLARWGIGDIPRLTPPKLTPPESSSPTPTIPSSLSGYTLDMNHPKYKNVTVTLGEQVFSQYSLVGRRTLVYNVTTNPRISDRDLVLKMSWQVCTRLSEAHILKQAKAKGVKHLPELHMWTESEDEYRLSQGIRCKLFPDNKKPDGKVAYEDRSLRFMVFTKYEAITLIISPSN
ncbi:hypothetical protein ABKN59_012073, partial [Abortiporus biennis]